MARAVGLRAGVIITLAWLSTLLLVGSGVGLQRLKTPSQPTKSKPRDTSSVIKGNAPFFTCPDGRRGLHVLHIRLLIGVTVARGSPGSFVATRNFFFRDFTLPSLSRQTAQGWVMYVTHDVAQDQGIVQSVRDMLDAALTRGAKYVFFGERGWINKAPLMLSYDRIVDVLVEKGIATREELESVDLYVTTRIDADDAAHVRTIELTQAKACSFIGPSLKKRMLILYPNPKRMWIPNENSTYGIFADINSKLPAGDVQVLEAGLAVKPVMQSMAVDKSLFACEINCYAHRHYQPWEIAAKVNATCQFSFKESRNWRDLQLPGGEIMALYSRSVGTSYYNRDLAIGYDVVPFDPGLIEAMGITRSELSNLNYVMSYLGKEAPEVLEYPKVAWNRGQRHDPPTKST